MQSTRPSFPGRGPLSLLRNCFGFLGIAASALAVGCAIETDPTGSGQEPVSVAPPAGCLKTVCDYLFEGCDDPCAQCWSSCGGEADRTGVIQCAHSCNDVCALAGDAGSNASCAEARERCREAHRHSICVDLLSDVALEVEHPCTREMSRANCACGTDAECAAALSQMNPRCSSCNTKWRVKCIETACKKEDQALFACLDANHCTTVAQCAE